MVHNPIYEGPVYESVLHPHFENLTLATTSDTSNSQVFSVAPDLDNREISESSSVRYIEQPPNQAPNSHIQSGLHCTHPIAAAEGEEKYTVMSPAGTINASSLKRVE